MGNYRYGYLPIVSIMTNIILIGTDKIVCPYVFSSQCKCKHGVKYTLSKETRKDEGMREGELEGERGEGGRVGGGWHINKLLILWSPFCFFALQLMFNSTFRFIIFTTRQSIMYRVYMRVYNR